MIVNYLGINSSSWTPFKKRIISLTNKRASLTTKSEFQLLSDVLAALETKIKVYRSMGDPRLE